MLLKALSDPGVAFKEQRNHTRTELQDFATTHGIDLVEQKVTILARWQGKSKGLLQVLWERGLIPEQSLEKYTNDGR